MKTVVNSLTDSNNEKVENWISSDCFLAFCCMRKGKVVATSTKPFPMITLPQCNAIRLAAGGNTKRLTVSIAERGGGAASVIISKTLPFFFFLPSLLRFEFHSLPITTAETAAATDDIPDQ